MEPTGSDSRALRVSSFASIPFAFVDSVVSRRNLPRLLRLDDMRTRTESAPAIAWDARSMRLFRLASPIVPLPFVALADKRDIRSFSSGIGGNPYARKLPTVPERLAAFVFSSLTSDASAD